MRRRRRAVCAPLVLLLVLGACTSKRIEPASTAPVRGGTLEVAVRDLSSLDPAKVSGRGATLVLAQIFRPLTTIGPDGNPQPGAASSWSVTPNGLQWDFAIAPATFHDGAPVTAADFKYAFDRIAQKATGSDVAFQLEAVKGFYAAKVAGTANTLTGVLAPSPKRLTILLGRPFSALPRFLSHPALVPIRKATFEKKAATFGAQPIGNGPFRVASPRTPTGVTLARFDGYAGEKTWLDEVKVEIRNDADETWSSLRSGKIHVGEVPPAHLADAKRLAGSDVGFTPFWAVTYYGLNLRLPKYANVGVRRALSLSIDREALARDVYGGTKDPATGIVPDGIGDSRETPPCDVCKLDLAAARALLNSVFKGKPPEFTIDHLDASPSREVAQAVAKMLEEAGLQVSLRAYSSGDYLKLLQSGKQDIAELGWLSDVPSPDSFLAQQLRTGSPNNQTGYSNPRFDATVELARSASTDADRAGRYDQAERLALSQMPLIPLVFFRNHIGIRSNVHGFRLNGAGIFDAAAVWLAPRR